MNTKARKLRKDFLQCADQRSIEENLNRVQDMYGYEEEVEAQKVIETTMDVVFGHDTPIAASNCFMPIVVGQEYHYKYFNNNSNSNNNESGEGTVIAETSGDPTYTAQLVFYGYSNNENNLVQVLYNSSTNEHFVSVSDASHEATILIETLATTTTHPINHKFLPEQLQIGKEIEKTEILAEMSTEGLTVSTNKDVIVNADHYNLDSDPFKNLVEGDTCIVIFDGVEYRGTWQSTWSEGVTYMYMSEGGGIYKANGSMGAFMIAYYQDAASRIYVSDSSVAHTIEVYRVTETITRFTEEYLPFKSAAAVADAAGETVTGTEFNALLASLRAAGLLKTE